MRDFRMRKIDKSLPDNCCLKCHFLVAYGYSKESMTQKERDDWYLKVSENLGMQGTMTGCCYKKVWDLPNIVSASMDPSTLSDFFEKEQLEKDRGKSCFFYEYQPWMSIDAAEELESRNGKQFNTSAGNERQKSAGTKIDSLSTRIGCLVGILGLIATVYFAVCFQSSQGTNDTKNKTNIIQNETMQMHDSISELPVLELESLENKPDNGIPDIKKVENAVPSSDGASSD